MDSILEILLPLISKYPVVSSILLIVGGLRVVLKPIMVAAKAYVDYTATTSDNEKLAAIESSKLYKTISFVLDYLASIKLPK